MTRDRRRTTHALTQTAVVFVLVVLALAATPDAANAHPLGNLSVNTFSRLTVAADKVTVEVVVDAAEIPTLQAFPDINRKRGAIDARERAAYQADRCRAIMSAIQLQAGGRDVALQVGAAALSFPPGSAGLRTSRLECTLSSPDELATPNSTLAYRITANTDRVGWREIVAVGDGVMFTSSDVSDKSISASLTQYPEDLLNSPLDQRDANITVGDAVAVAPLARAPDRSPSVLPRGLDRFSTAFTDLVARRDLTLGFALLALLIAVGLGALHAFAPGHGKTVMAAYLVGREGSFRQAAIVGMSVTATHTLGVLALGVALTGAGLASPERVYPWLGTLSGLLLAGIGAGLLLRHHRSRGAGHAAIAPGEAEAHNHDHGRDAAPHGRAEHGSHRHGLVSHTHAPPPTSVRGLITMGFAGGLVPSPSALLVLLGGVALGRAWFGVLLVVAYGIGMAVALIGTGLLLVSARDAVGRLMSRRSESPRAHRVVTMVGGALPTVTAGVVVIVGLGIALRSVAQI